MKTGIASHSLSAGKKQMCRQQDGSQENTWRHNALRKGFFGKLAEHEHLIRQAARLAQKFHDAIGVYVSEQGLKYGYGLVGVKRESISSSRAFIEPEPAVNGGVGS